MRFFTKHEVPEVLKELSLEQRVEDALRMVNEADAKFTAASKALYDFCCRYQITRNNLQQIKYCGLPNGAPADLSEQRDKLVLAESAAQREYHSCLNQWCGLKGN